MFYSLITLIIRDNIMLIYELTKISNLKDMLLKKPTKIVRQNYQSILFLVTFFFIYFLILNFKFSE